MRVLLSQSDREKEGQLELNIKQTLGPDYIMVKRGLFFCLIEFSFFFFSVEVAQSCRASSLSLCQIVTEAPRCASTYVRCKIGF